MSNFRTPVPEDEYLRLLGRAGYTWAYVEWVMIYAVHWLTQDDMAKHAGGTGGAIVRAFKRAVESPSSPTGVDSDAWERARRSRGDLVAANHRRNDILHARPATAPGGSQRLNRWAPGRSNVTAGLIEVPDLLKFIALVERAHAEIEPLHDQLARRAQRVCERD